MKLCLYNKYTQIKRKERSNIQTCKKANVCAPVLRQVKAVVNKQLSFQQIQRFSDTSAVFTVTVIRVQ